MQIPNAPADLTPAWLTDILRQSGMLRDSSVVSIKISLVPDGRGFAAQSARLRLTYDIAGNDAPRSMFLKLSVANPDSREKLRVVGLYETETGFYRELNGSCPLRTPQVYASLYEPHTGESLLLLEDIGSLRFGDNLTGSTIEEARTAISSLARMQAHYWNNPQMEKCVWLRSAKHDRQDVPTLYRSLRPIFEKRWASITPTSILAAAQMLDERCDIWLESHLAGPRTLVHGDFRPDNFAFERNGEIVVFDWQTARFDPGSRDVAYFLAFALPADLRRAHESALLALYYQTLLSHGVQDYSFEQVLTNHRRSVGSAAMRLVMAGAFVEFSNERARQLVAALFERVGAALEDHSFTSWEPTV